MVRVARLSYGVPTSMPMRGVPPYLGTSAAVAVSGSKVLPSPSEAAPMKRWRRASRILDALSCSMFSIFIILHVVGLLSGCARRKPTLKMFSRLARRTGEAERCMGGWGVYLRVRNGGGDSYGPIALTVPVVAVVFQT